MIQEEPDLDKSPASTTDFRFSSLMPRGALGTLAKLFGPLVDRILGFKRMRDRFKEYGLAGLDPHSFVTRGLKSLRIEVLSDPKQLESIPRKGGAIIVANHPYGGIEGMIMASLILKVRPDVKFLANRLLGTITELREIIILTNPLVKNHPGNVGSLWRCMGWLEDGHLLVLFPAGKVAFYQRRKGMITDGRWNRIAGLMVNHTQAPTVPMHISGSNSRLFDILGRIYYRFRLLMLPRELLKAKNRSVTVRIGKPIPYAQLAHFRSTRALTDYLRMRTYLLDSEGVTQPERNISDAKRIADPLPESLLRTEIEALPEEQLLFTLKDNTVYYGCYEQIPHVVTEIARLREITFRELNEGSGEALDTDGFDKTYIHLFIWSEAKGIVVGAYRMGRTDLLLKNGDLRNLYLSQLFRFSPSFIDKVTPGMEMGRSFLRKEYQRSFQGLFLLWRGIGEFVLRHPRYHTLYGTVSLSTTYHPYSLALMSKVLVGDTFRVEPINKFEPILPKEVEQYVRRRPLSVNELSRLVRAIEPNGIDIPILVKQYLRIGAEFHSIAIDRGFNNTPGALLSVDIRSATPDTHKMFLGDRYAEYLRHHGIDPKR